LKGDVDRSNLLKKAEESLEAAESLFNICLHCIMHNFPEHIEEVSDQ
jgi:hypothetical protein